MKGFYYIMKGNDIMRAKQVMLKQEVTRNDALVIKDWLENHEVNKHLNEGNHIAQEIYNMVNRVNMFIMTHLFNRDGRFYMICKDNNHPIGFLKLVHQVNEAEMVVVIGDEDNWGQGFGTASIEQGLQEAFFQLRKKRVIAKIKSDNIRSIRAFEKVGFQLEKDLDDMKLFSLTMDDYIKSIII